MAMSPGQKMIKVFTAESAEGAERKEGKNGERLTRIYTKRPAGTR
jgi:hypothetical protein